MEYLIFVCKNIIKSVLLMFIMNNKLKILLNNVVFITACYSSINLSYSMEDDE